MSSGKKVIDTSPKIAEYGVYWNRTYGSKTQSDSWCITEWYEFDTIYHGRVIICGYCGTDTKYITFQYNGVKDDESTYKSWYYFNGFDHRTSGIGNATLHNITFSIEIAKIDDAYAYVKETGQIFFAGKNTPYYGYTNINDMPT